MAASGDFEFDDLFSSSPSASLSISVPSGCGVPICNIPGLSLREHGGKDEKRLVPDGAGFEERSWSDDEDEDGDEGNASSGSDDVDGVSHVGSDGIELSVQAPPSEVIPLSTTVSLDCFENLKIVGKGGYGKVFQVRMKATGEIYAMKALKKRYLIKSNCVENTIAERDILKKIHHPFVVGLHWAFQTSFRLYLVMDFVNGGQLLFHLRREAMFSEDQARFYLAELVLALEHLHSQGIVHRDLKPENILLDSDGHCVLTDFGFAKEMMSSDDSGAESFCGTLEYMAPEMIKGEGYGKAADWWSLGVLVYDMLVGHPPFQHKSDHALQQKILNDKIYFPRYLSGPARSLIQGLMERNTEKRLGSGPKGIAAIKAHAFFKKIHWGKIFEKEVTPPIRPAIKHGKMDVSQFDDEYLKMPLGDSPVSPLSASLQDKFKGFSYVRSPTMTALF